jgi:hypothetical protein
MGVVLQERAEAEAGKESCFVVVDSNNRWLWYGIAKSRDEAVKEAKQSSFYDENATLYVYEVINEYIVKMKPIQNQEGEEKKDAETIR